MDRARYIVLDVGTTAVKASVIDPIFRIVGYSAKEYRLETKGGLVELNPEKYTAAAAVCIREALQTTDKCEIKGIVVTTQGETIIPVDASGNALCKAIVWLDNRAERQAKMIEKLVDEDVFYERTGIPRCNGLCPISKLLWIKEEAPEVYEAARYFLLLEDYLIYWLSGVFATEKSLMSTTGYYDIRKDELWIELLEKTGIDQGKFPPVYECGETIAKILPERAEQLGISKEVFVVTAAMDQVCAALGAGNCVPGKITETTGTAMCIGATIDEFPSRMPYRVPVYRHFASEKYLLVSVCMTAGIILKWFKDTFCAEEQRTAERKGKSVYKVLDDMAAQSEPMSGGVTLLPYFSGMLQPYELPEIRGSFRGIGLNNTKADFVRGIMEGVGFILRENLEMIEQVSGKKAERIVSMGGAAKGECWCQLKADITGSKILSSQQPETTSIGAAALAAVALKDYESVEQAIQAIPVSRKEYKPREKNVVLYEKGYCQYRIYAEEEIRRIKYRGRGEE